MNKTINSLPKKLQSVYQYQTFFYQYWFWPQKSSIGRPKAKTKSGFGHEMVVSSCGFCTVCDRLTTNSKSTSKFLPNTWTLCLFNLSDRSVHTHTHSSAGARWSVITVLSICFGPGHRWSPTVFALQQ